MTVPRRFGIIRFVGNLLKVLAWIFLILSILGAVGMIVAWPTLSTQLLAQMLPGLRANIEPTLQSIGGIVLAVPLLIISLIYFFAFYVAGENMILRLAVEENTRLTAALLLRMHQDTQPEPQGRPGYSGGGYGGGFEDR